MTRILAFTDPHGSLESASAILELAQREQPEHVVCAGDFSYFGTRFDGFLTRLRELGKVVYYVNGNHETEATTREMECWFPFMQNVEYQVVDGESFRIGGLPATGEYWPGGRADEGAVHSATAMLKNPGGLPFILLSHYPPWMSAIAGYSAMTPDSGGSRTVLRILDALKPTLVICGHYHQDFGKEDRIGPIRLVNPGPNGKIIEI
jgi:Icc-related predicted phosphoesterase